MKTLCIYHGNCIDGFAAAWVVRKALGSDVEFFAGFYGAKPPDVTRRDVIIVDFSYKAPVLHAMAADANTIVILDHHKTAAEDLAAFPRPPSGPYSVPAMLDCQREHNAPCAVHALFDMDRSGAGLAWDYFNPGMSRPRLLDHIEDRDLWRFRLPDTRELHSAVVSYEGSFDVWDRLVEASEDRMSRRALAGEGRAIHRKLMKDIREMLGVVTRPMIIGGVRVPVANLPSMMASEAGNLMAAGAPFAATYYDSADARLFSLRSNSPDGADVSEIAKLYGGGGHRNAAGFRMPIGWEGDASGRGGHG